MLRRMKGAIRSPLPQGPGLLLPVRPSLGQTTPRRRQCKRWLETTHVLLLVERKPAPTRKRVSEPLPQETMNSKMNSNLFSRKVPDLHCIQTL